MHETTIKEVTHTLTLTDKEMDTLGCIAYHFEEELLIDKHTFIPEMVKMTEELIKIRKGL